jgi:hypothetical protein
MSTPRRPRGAGFHDMELYSVLADCELFGDGAVAYARCHGPQHIASAPTEGTECSRRSNAAGGARGRRVARSLLHQGVADRIVLSSVDVSVDGVPVPSEPTERSATICAKSHKTFVAQAAYASMEGQEGCGPFIGPRPRSSDQ